MPSQDHTTRGYGSRFELNESLLHACSLSTVPSSPPEGVIVIYLMLTRFLEGCDEALLV